MYRSLLPLLLLVSLLFTPAFPSAPARVHTAAAEEPSPLVSLLPAVLDIKVFRSDWEGSSLGSAVLIDDRGHALTSWHVVHGARTITTEDGDAGEIIAHDATLDLALLKIDGRHPVHVCLREQPALLGEPVYAIGNACGYGHTVTHGIISATRRKLTMPSGAVLRNLLQTDAALNPGNSGGPLIDHHGKVLGLAVAIRDGAPGLAWAISVPTLQKFLKQNLPTKE